MPDDDSLLAQGTVDARTEERLFAMGRTRPVPLTDRQQKALELITAGQPIRSDDLGAELHAWKLANGFRGHAAYATCDFCVSEGRSVGDALARRGLVRYLRGKGWVLQDFQENQESQASSQLGPDDDFPEGF